MKLFWESDRETFFFRIRQRNYFVRIGQKKTIFCQNRKEKLFFFRMGQGNWRLHDWLLQHPTHAQPCQRMKQQHVFFDGDIRVILRRIFCLKYKKAQTCVRRCHQRFSLCLSGVYLAAFPSAIFARSVLARFQHQTHSILSEKSKNLPCWDSQGSFLLLQNPSHLASPHPGQKLM